MEVPWKKIYLLDEESIDKEHKELFEVANEAFKVVDPSKKAAKVKVIVQRFYRYTKVHFENEESFMQSIGYPHLQEHSKIHNQTMEMISDLIKKLPSTTISQFERDLARFLHGFATNHILKEDMKIKEWLDKQKSIQKKLPKHKLIFEDTKLDQDHKDMFDLCKELLQDTKDDISKHIKSLEKYQKEHFCEEEALMKKVNYEDIDSHISSHESLDEKISQLVLKAASMDQKRAKREIFNLVSKDIIPHIEKEDIKIAIWIDELKQIKDIE